METEHAVAVLRPTEVPGHGSLPAENRGYLPKRLARLDPRTAHRTWMWQRVALYSVSRAELLNRIGREEERKMLAKPESAQAVARWVCAARNFKSPKHGERDWGGGSWEPYPISASWWGRVRLPAKGGSNGLKREKEKEWKSAPILQTYTETKKAGCQAFPSKGVFPR